MAFVRQRYGKANVRVLRVQREGNRHQARESRVNVILDGDRMPQRLQLGGELCSRSWRSSAADSRRASPAVMGSSNAFKSQTSVGSVSTTRLRTAPGAPRTAWLQPIVGSELLDAARDTRA